MSESEFNSRSGVEYEVALRLLKLVRRFSILRTEGTFVRADRQGTPPDVETLFWVVNGIKHGSRRSKACTNTDHIDKCKVFDTFLKIRRSTLAPVITMYPDAIGCGY